MNRIRVFTSGALFLFVLYCLIWNPALPFALPGWVYGAATLYFAFFPIKDMLAPFNRTLYKGRQFGKHYVPLTGCEKEALQKMKRSYNLRALSALAFWMVFMAVPGALYLSGSIGRIWIVFFFSLSNFSVFFAIFGWCPFRSIFIRPDCCMECRIYNWDSFFQYSFLIFLPNPYTIFLFGLGLLSLVEWEIMHVLHPERFYKISNAALTCENCDLEACHKKKKKLFHKTLTEEYATKP